MKTHLALFFLIGFVTGIGGTVFYMFNVDSSPLMVRDRMLDETFDEILALADKYDSCLSNNVSKQAIK